MIKAATASLLLLSWISTLAQPLTQNAMPREIQTAKPGCYQNCTISKQGCKEICFQTIEPQTSGGSTGTGSTGGTTGGNTRGATRPPDAANSETSRVPGAIGSSGTNRY